MSMELTAFSATRRAPHRHLADLAGYLPADGVATLPDGVVTVLEDRVAALLGKPAALFFPTGTMAQQVALRVHAQRRGRATVALHPESHLEEHEERGYAFVHGLSAVSIGARGRLLTAADLDDVTDPVAAVLVELPQRRIGGQLPSWRELVELTARARDLGAAAHLDGARIWEAQPFYDRPHAELAGLFDSVYVSLYKGLEGIAGAVLAGDGELIRSAATWRQRLGGALVQAWPFAASGLLGLDRQMPRMGEFWAHARALAAALAEVPGVTIVPAVPQCPIFHVHVDVPRDALLPAAASVAEDLKISLLRYAESAATPGRSIFEITVGEHGLDVSPSAAAAALTEVLARARIAGS